MERKFFRAVFFITTVGLLVSCKPKINVDKQIPEGAEIFETEYLKYFIDEGKAWICGLTEKGEEQTNLIIPAKIDSIEVKRIGQDVIITDNNIYSENLNKLFFMSNNIQFDIQSFYGNGSNISYIVRVNNEVGTYMSTCGAYRIYCDNDSVSEFNKAASEYYKKDEVNDYYYSTNVSFYYNYEDSPNKGLFFCDHVIKREHLFCNIDPERSGYTFTGWYKESTCVTKVNIEEEKMGDTDIDLYAGWEMI